MESQLPPATFELLEAFLQHLRVERGLSPRTLVNYKIDLEKFLHFLKTAGKDPLSVTRVDLTDYLWHKKAAGMQSASIARYMASLRAFYRFLSVEGRRADDPTSL